MKKKNHREINIKERFLGYDLSILRILFLVFCFGRELKGTMLRNMKTRFHKNFVRVDVLTANLPIYQVVFLTTSPPLFMTFITKFWNTSILGQCLNNSCKGNKVILFLVVNVHEYFISQTVNFFASTSRLFTCLLLIPYQFVI